MSDRDDDILPAADVTPQATASTPRAPDSASDVPVRSRGAGIALALSVIALAGAGYAAWQAHLSGRGEHNMQADLLQRTDALDARLDEAERRAARSNELASTLSQQLGENERLRQRLQEDLLALADRSARAEALLADLSRDRQSGPRGLGAEEARQLLIQAESRLLLGGDRRGAVTALDLASRALDGQNSYADLRTAITAASQAIAADTRPTGHELLVQLDALGDRLADISSTHRPQTNSTATGAHTGWWGRQFERIDHLISIRREDEVSAAPVPSRDAARAALQRARLAALSNDPAAVQSGLRSTRSALAACCEGADTQALLADLDRLLAIEWQAASPDLAALRQRLDDRIELDLRGPETPSPGTTPDSSSEQETST